MSNNSERALERLKQCYPGQYVSIVGNCPKSSTRFLYRVNRGNIRSVELSGCEGLEKAVSSPGSAFNQWSTATLLNR